MAYKVKHIHNHDHESEIYDHEQLVQEALDQIGEGEIYSIQHSYTGEYGGYVSTLIVYRDYEDTI